MGAQRAAGVRANIADFPTTHDRRRYRRFAVGRQSEVGAVAYSGRRSLRLDKRMLVALACVQAAVPLWATYEGAPHKFGFHMFTGDEPMSVHVLDPVGHPVEVDLADWIVVAREDIDWSARLSPMICRDVEDAATVIVRQWGTDRVFTC